MDRQNFLRVCFGCSLGVASFQNSKFSSSGVERYLYSNWYSIGHYRHMEKIQYQPFSDVSLFLCNMFSPFLFKVHALCMCKVHFYQCEAPDRNVLLQDCYRVFTIKSFWVHDWGRNITLLLKWQSMANSGKSEVLSALRDNTAVILVLLLVKWRGKLPGKCHSSNDQTRAGQ